MIARHMDWSTSIRNKVYVSLKNILNSTLTHRCEMCLQPCQEKEFVCFDCESELPQAQKSCHQCAIPMAGGGICGQCLQHQPAFDNSHCNYLYQAPLDRWLHTYKHRNRTEWSIKLSRLMLTQAPHNIDQIDAITFVPSSRLSLLRRGFNPAELLAMHIADSLELPLRKKLASRSHSKQQKELNHLQRVDNVRNSFQLKKQKLNGQHILLIDDVMTTGSTAHTMAALLKQAGASEVTVWCLARVPLQS